MKKYFIVTAKCGHVGRNHFISIDFPVVAHSGRQAATIIRFTPRVKHHHKDAILNVQEVSYETYEAQRLVNQQDPYLNVSNKQDQNEAVLDLDTRMLREERPRKEFSQSERKERIRYRQKREQTIKYISLMQ